MNQNNFMDKLTPQQLNNDLIRQKISQIFERVIENDNKQSAYNLFKAIQESIEKKSDQLLPQFRPFYQSVVRRLEFLFWPVSPRKDQIEFLKDNLANLVNNSDWYLNHHYPWDNQILTGMFMYPLTTRNDLRRLIKQAFDQNQGKIGPLAIREWLSDYNKFQDFTQRTKISHLEYLAQSPKVAQLTKKDKDALRQLLRFYDDYLLVTPVSPVAVSPIVTPPIKKFKPPTISSPFPQKTVNQTISKQENPKIVDLRK